LEIVCPLAVPSGRLATICRPSAGELKVGPTLRQSVAEVPLPPHR
jgi:hypothetical protein